MKKEDKMKSFHSFLRTSDLFPLLWQLSLFHLADLCTALLDYIDKSTGPRLFISLNEVR